jgi:hypothetical protein
LSRSLRHLRSDLGFGRARSPSPNRKRANERRTLAADTRAVRGETLERARGRCRSARLIFCQYSPPGGRLANFGQSRVGQNHAGDQEFG